MECSVLSCRSGKRLGLGGGGWRGGNQADGGLRGVGEGGLGRHRGEGG